MLRLPAGAIGPVPEVVVAQPIAEQGYDARLCFLLDLAHGAHPLHPPECSRSSQRAGFSTGNGTGIPNLLEWNILQSCQ